MNAQERKVCFADEYLREAIAKDPSVLSTQQQLEDFTRQFVSNLERQNRAGNPQNRINTPPTYIIPVVFHVLHQYGPENISDAQIHDCIRHMNEDYRKLNPDTIQIISQFIPIATDCEIEFRLATLDQIGRAHV